MHGEENHTPKDDAPRLHLPMQPRLTFNKGSNTWPNEFLNASIIVYEPRLARITVLA